MSCWSTGCLVSVFNDLKDVALLSLASSRRDDRAEGLRMRALLADDLANVLGRDFQLNHTGMLADLFLSETSGVLFFSVQGR